MNRMSAATATAQEASQPGRAPSAPLVGSLGDYALRDKGALVRVAVWGLAWTLPSLLVGRLVASAVDGAVAGETLTLVLCLAGLAATAVVAAFSLLALSRASAGAVRRMTLDMMRDVVHATLHREVYQRTSRGGVELLQHLPAVLNSMASLLRSTLPLSLAGLGSLLGLATISWVLLAITAPWVLFGLAIRYLYLRTYARRMRAEMTTTELAHAETTSVLQATRDFVAADATRFAIDRVRRRLEDSLHAAVALAKNQVKGDAALGVTTIEMPVISALVAAPFLVSAGAISAGEVVGAMLYLVAGMGSLAGLAALLTNIAVTLRVYFARILEANADAKQTAAEDNAGTPTIGDAPTLRAQGLSFQYKGAARPIVSQFDLEIPFGENLAIVGPSGVGKSTLAWLLSGLLPADGGVVTLAGAPIHGMANRQDFIAVVPQESYVFHGTLRENLLYLGQDRTDAEIAKVAESIGLQRVIDRIGSLDADVNIEKSGLSEGEQQLIGLARALLCRAPILVLDEATCHLDPHSAAVAEQAVRHSGKTIITVAHRMSSVLDANRLVVMEGENTIIGPHAQVRTKSELFRQFESLGLPTGT